MPGCLDDKPIGCAGGGSFKQEPDIGSKEECKGDKYPSVHPGIVSFQEDDGYVDQNSDEKCKECNLDGQLMGVQVEIAWESHADESQPRQDSGNGTKNAEPFT